MLSVRRIRYLSRIVIFSVIGCFIAGMVGLMGWALQNKDPVTGLSGITRVGKAAPDFTLTLFDGEPLVLSRLMGRPLVINFWASWCPPCLRELPSINKLQASLGGNMFTVIALNIDQGG